MGVPGVTGARRLWSAVSIRFGLTGLQDLRWTGGDAEETTLESRGILDVWCSVMVSGCWRLKWRTATRRLSISRTKPAVDYRWSSTYYAVQTPEGGGGGTLELFFFPSGSFWVFKC